MKKRIGSAILALCMTMLLWLGTAIADSGFAGDTEAINRAAKSVVMLEVYNAWGSCFATGSGFMAFNNSTLITNYHVIDGGSYVIANTDDGEKYRTSTVLCSNKKLDVAILSFDSPTNLEPLSLYCGDDFMRGDAVVAIGSPIGIKNTVSEGIISTFYTDDDVPYIQITAAISHGSSGGALFNGDGQVIGITSAIYTHGENMGLAIRSTVPQAMYNSWDGKTHDMADAPKYSTVDYSTISVSAAGNSVKRLSDSVQWVCPECSETNTSVFCLKCGKPRPVWICKCGVENVSSFCGKCGESVQGLIDQFNAACENLNSGNYDAAITGFASLSLFDSETYETSMGKNSGAASMLPVCRYTWGKQMLAEEQYEESIAQLGEAGDYLDAATRIGEAWYRWAEKQLADENYDDAAAKFKKAGNYEDAANRVRMTYYAKAEALLAAKDYDGASKAFADAESYSDAAQRVGEPYYVQAEELLAEGKKEEAIAAFQKAGDYGDASVRIQKIYYADAENLLAVKDYDGASKAFADAGDYSDAEQRILEPYYVQAETLLAENEYDAAIEAFSKAEQYADASERIPQTYYAKAEALLDEGKEDDAIAAFAQDGSYSDAGERISKIYYARAEALLADGQEEEAGLALLQAGDYEDANARGSELLYTLGNAAVKAKDYAHALILYTAIDGYEDAHAKWQDTVYKRAAELVKAKDYEQAYELYSQIADYKDVAKTLKSNKNLKALRMQHFAEMGFVVNSVVTFGSYCQSNDQTKEPIEWLVLEVDEKNEKALLISKYGLDAKAYNTKDTDVTWETCTLRKWLNDDFLNTCFDSKAQQSAILTTIVDNSSSQGFSALGIIDGNDTQDKVFLLSYTEASMYFEFLSLQSTKASVLPTDYARAHGAFTNPDYTVDSSIYGTTGAPGGWWLRSPGRNLSEVMCVYVDGAMKYSEVSTDAVCVRPALWLDLDTVQMMKASYSEAETLFENGDYENAALIYAEIDGYEDSHEKRQEAIYRQATLSYEANDYENAALIYAKIDGYADSHEKRQEAIYRQAAISYEKKEYEEAYERYHLILGYKDVDALLSTDENLTAVARAEYDVGKTVVLGSYGNEAVEWIVLDADGDNRLLISKYGLDAKPYNTEEANVTWETCAIRKWLNSDFLKACFDNKLQSAIQMTSVDNSKGQGYSGYASNNGNNTQDKIFLLSYSEAEAYFGAQHFSIKGANNTKASVSPTSYAIKNGAKTNNEYKTQEEMQTSWWWLRSTGSRQFSAALVYPDGTIGDQYVQASGAVARPAFWLDLNAIL